MDIAIIVAVILAIIALIIYMVYEEGQNNVIHNPTFIGEVVGKESVVRSVGGTWAMRYTEFRLHIVGEYIKDNETIHVDRVFRVYREFYNRFDIGDIFSHEP